MHSDFQSKKPKTELESLTGYVVHTGQRLGVTNPTFARQYQELKMRKETDKEVLRLVKLWEFRPAVQNEKAFSVCP